MDACVSKQGSVTDSFEHGNKPSVSIKGGQLLEQQSEY
jgi:hypothetical protein